MIYIIKGFALVATAGLLFFSCNQKNGDGATIQPANTGFLNVRTQFYDSSGNSIFMAPMKIWYVDSVSIQEIVTIKSITDTSQRTTVSFIPQIYRYIDLKKNTWYDYKTFSDTARMIKSGILPDALFPNGGWTFYVNHLRMKTEPEELPDTTIGTIKYRKIKFLPLNRPRPDSYIIGYLRCDNKGKLFSFEKDYSNKVNCTMTRYYEFRKGALKPFASSELEFLSDTLTEKELKVFSAWEKNQRAYPVH